MLVYTTEKEKYFHFGGKNIVRRTCKIIKKILMQETLGDDKNLRRFVSIILNKKKNFFTFNTRKYKGSVAAFCDFCVIEYNCRWSNEDRHLSKSRRLTCRLMRTCRAEIGHPTAYLYLLLKPRAARTRESNRPIKKKSAPAPADPPLSQPSRRRDRATQIVKIK